MRMRRVRVAQAMRLPMLVPHDSYYSYYHHYHHHCYDYYGWRAYARVPFLAHRPAASGAAPDDLRRVIALLLVPDALAALGVLFGAHALLLLALLLLLLALLLALLAPLLVAVAVMHLAAAAHLLRRNLPRGCACTALSAESHARPHF